MSNELDYRPSYLAASIAAGLTFLLYLITLSPETAMWDTSEYIVAAYTMGLPHPPGNPFFVLIGRVFTILPIAPTVAMRINLLAAISSAVSAGMWFLITERVLVGWFEKRWQRIVGGGLAALIGATAFTVWSQSVVNEKVYTISLVGLAISAWLTVRWCDEPDGKKADRTLVLLAYLAGLGYANHMAGMLAIPAIGLAVLIRKPATILRWQLILAAVAAMFLGGSSFATQPIRAAHFPEINEGEPTACRNGLEFSCTFSKGTYDAFKYNFDRGQYAKPPVTERQAPFKAQIGMWWLYFKWQWLRDAHGENPGLQGGLAALFLVLGILGGWVHYRRDPRSFAFFGPLMLTLTFVLIYYLNFKYGASQDPELGRTVDREVRDRDYFFLWSFSAWSVWAALGLVYLWESIAVLLGSEKVKVGLETFDLPTTRAFLIASPLLLIAFVPLVGNWNASTRSGQTDTADFAIDLLNSVEPYGILVTVGDNDTFPLWYAQEVLGIRKDVTVANTSLLNTDWYTRQLIRRPVFEYDEAAGPAAFRGKTWPKPTGPVLKMTTDEADRLPLYEEVRSPVLFKKGNINALIQPRVLPRAEILVLRMLNDNNERAVHFSRTSADLAESLGLGEYVVMQGHSRRVMPDTVREGGGIVRIGGEGFVNVDVSKALWDEFKAPASLIRKGDWIDQPSAGIPYLVVTTGLATAEALIQSGRGAEANAIIDKARDVAVAMRFAELAAALPQTNVAIPTTDSNARVTVPLRPPAAPRQP
ncbi:MAG: DUF2723 domain-containing protein [Gemmatimonadetes bacterium]|nr:DUF2723 domain-containing protein [Gemmatimonadota bacterium]